MINQFLQSIIVVDDMEKSLHFYRDILHFKVQIDQEMQGEEISTILGKPGVRVRLVLLQVGEQKTALVGLASFVSSEKDKTDQESRVTYQHALVFGTDDIDGVYNSLKKAGARVLCTPVTMGMNGGGKVKIFTCLDPNGVLVEFNQFIP
jgi:catechol 2,3-dioxygenase-like lactoylglutathione lyase family enzyme